MAKTTNKELRNMTVYQVYVRSYSKEGSFRALEADLDRIAALGADIIYLLPVHPIGKEQRKGSLGSPYAISDYRVINAELGTAEDFDSLVKAIHQKGMKCIMDVVYNHTSPDSLLAKTNPQWFYHPTSGGFGNRIGDWWDVIDLDYTNPRSGLWEYQIETLKTWAALVDGFRCDVASLVPLEFWLRAREEVSLVNPGCLWIAESVEPSFILENRARGFNCLSDAELFQAFDVCYDYDIFAWFKKYLNGAVSLSSYMEQINLQESIYGDNYIKLRCLENHDQNRAAFFIPHEKALRNWTAFNYFQKGLTMIYAGEEWQNDHRPSLFEKEVIKRPENSAADLSSFMRTLYDIKKDPVFADSSYEVMAAGNRGDLKDVILGIHRSRPGIKAPQENPKGMAGVFNLKGTSGPAPVDKLGLKDGLYTNLIDKRPFYIEGGRLSLQGEPVIFRF